MIHAERLKDVMSARSLSQSELARRVGVTQTTIRKLVSGGYGSKHLHRIARELHTTTEYLEGKVDDPDEGADTGQRLSSDEQEWVDIYEALTPEQRRNLRSIARDMARGNSPSERIHDSRDGYGAPRQ